MLCHDPLHCALLFLERFPLLLVLFPERLHLRIVTRKRGGPSPGQYREEGRTKTSQELFHGTSTTRTVRSFRPAAQDRIAFPRDAGRVTGGPGVDPILFFRRPGVPRTIHRAGSARSQRLPAGRLSVSKSSDVTGLASYRSITN